MEEGEGKGAIYTPSADKISDVDGMWTHMNCKTSLINALV